MSQRIVSGEEALRILNDTKQRLMAKKHIIESATPRQAAMTMIHKLLGRVPIHTGETAQGISAHPEGKGYRVTSQVSGAFKQNIYTDMQEASNYYLGGRDRLPYSQVAKTGVPGWFTLTAKEIEGMFKDIITSEVRGFKIIK